MCTDIRLLASLKEIEEPFEIEQIGKRGEGKAQKTEEAFIGRLECHALQA